MICFQCNKEGHYRWECPRKIRNQEIAPESRFSFRKDKQLVQKYKTKKVHKVQHSDSEASVANSSLENECPRYSVESVTCVYCHETVYNTLKNFWLMLAQLNDCLVTFSVDTRAHVSLLDKVTWNRIGRPELINEQEKLRNASNRIMTFKKA